MSRFARISVVFGLILALTVPAVLASGASSTKEPKEKGAGGDPVAKATAHFNSGLAARDKAWKFEEKAAEASSEGQRSKLLAKAQKQYGNALAEFQDAVAKNPKFYQALGSLGYTLRKTGEYDAAMRAYNRALELHPTYAEAIEYRGEALLELGRTDEAKEAYLQLFGQDRGKADMLMVAMKSHNSEKPNADFSAWIAEREEIAGHTVSLTELKQRKW